jgi:hypothetical protein
MGKQPLYRKRMNKRDKPSTHESDELVSLFLLEQVYGFDWYSCERLAQYFVRNYSKNDTEYS